MKLFGLGRRGKSGEQAAPEKARVCTHPVAYQVALHEDLSDRSKLTGLKCSQCGERLPVR